MANATLQAALEEAWASAPDDVIVLETLEIMHDTLTTPIRLVRWPVVDSQPVIFKLRLEATAPIDGGEVVEFIGAPFEITLPDQEMGTIGSFTISIDGVDDLLDEYMRNAALSGGVISAVFREYIKEMADEGPGTVWSGIELSSPRVEGMTFVVEGAVLNWMQRAYGSLYTAMQYPGLVAGR